MNHTQFNSQELNNATTVAANQIQPPATNTSLQQIESDLLSLFMQKDNSLFKHFNAGKAHARISISTEEFMTSVVEEFRRYIYSACVNAGSDVSAVHINKIFDIIQLNLNLIKSFNLPYKRNELVASVQGNLLKHIL